MRPQHPNQKQGFNAASVYSVHDIDSVNVFNGNLTVSVPLGPEFPLADGFSYRLRLHSNGNFWESEVEDDAMVTDPEAKGLRDVASTVVGCDSSDGYTVAHPHRRANVGLGWIVTLGRLYPWQSSLVGGWTYESPDGADHRFYDSIRPGTAGAAGAMYTRDGSYLRLTVNETIGRATLEFPDGTYHTFAEGDSAEAPWLPIEFAHRRSTHKLTISYPTTTQWVLTDSHGRSHEVNLAPLTWEGGKRLLVTSVKLMAFTPEGAQQRWATYSLAYEQHSGLPRPPWHEPCLVAWPNKVTIQKLKSVTFPAGGGEGTFQYGFAYDTGAMQSPGVLSKATLPTGGSVSWEWRTWQKPTLSAADGSEYLAESWGVWKRRLSRPGQATHDAEWKYEGYVDGDYDDETSQSSRELHTEVVDPYNRTTLHFFVASPLDGTTDGVA